MNESYKEETIKLSPENRVMSENDVYKQNLESCRNKISTYEFVSTITKVDFYFETLQGYLYWGGLSEFLIWIVLLGLFISDYKDMAKIWFFILHVPRGIIGLVILYYIPKTYQVVDQVEQYETKSLQEIKKEIGENYVKTMMSKEKYLKPLLIIYFVFSLVSMIVDLLLFCVITPDFGGNNKGLMFVILFLAVCCFIAEDFIYVIFFTSFKYTFPPEQNEAVRKAVIGFFSQLKVGIATGFTNIAKKIGRNSTNSHNNHTNGNEPSSTSNVNGNSNGNANYNGNGDKAIDVPFEFNNNNNEIAKEDNIDTEFNVPDNNNI